MGNALGEATGPGLLKGMKGTTPETDVGDKFRARLKKVDPKLIDFNYAGESYDAVVISALAASKAKSTNGKGIAANIVAVTTGGTECTTFKTCLALLDEGKAIAYKGPTGNLALNAAGDPTKGSYSVREFGKDNKLGDPKFVVVQAQ
jgi:branched-chain amino acid transport system substrate-binding protein